MIIERKRREAETRRYRFDRCCVTSARFEWTVNRCLVVTAGHEAKSMRGNPIGLSDPEVIEIVTHSL